MLGVIGATHHGGPVMVGKLAIGTVVRNARPFLDADDTLDDATEDTLKVKGEFESANTAKHTAPPGQRNH